MLRAGVGVAENGHRLHAQPLGRALHATGNLAAVGDENLVEELGLARAREEPHAPRSDDATHDPLVPNEKNCVDSKF